MGKFIKLDSVQIRAIKGSVAGGQGLEPWIMGPEPIVLPLYYPPAEKSEIQQFLSESQGKIEFLIKTGFVRFKIQGYIGFKAKNKNNLTGFT